MQKQERVADHAEIKSVGIKSIRRVNPEPVYNMEVEDNHNFAVADGLIVHNCMDSMRYFCKTKRVIPTILKRNAPTSSIYMHRRNNA